MLTGPDYAYEIGHRFAIPASESSDIEIRLLTSSSYSNESSFWKVPHLVSSLQVSVVMIEAR
jgi:hypothetical protein